jgi:hypothetical protein
MEMVSELPYSQPLTNLPETLKFVKFGDSGIHVSTINLLEKMFTEYKNHKSLSKSLNNIKIMGDNSILPKTTLYCMNIMTSTNSNCDEHIECISDSIEFCTKNQNYIHQPTVNFFVSMIK